jgi:hypothetical protein
MTEIITPAVALIRIARNIASKYLMSLAVELMMLSCLFFIPGMKLYSPCYHYSQEYVDSSAAGRVQFSSTLIMKWQPRTTVKG